MFTTSKLIERATRCHKNGGGTPKPPAPPKPPSPTQAANNSALAMRSSRQKSAVNYGSALMGLGKSNTLGGTVSQSGSVLLSLLGR